MSNLVIGAGQLFFQPDGASGEILLAQTPSLTLGITPTQLQVFDADTPIEQLLLDTSPRIDRHMKAEVRDISDAALALFFGTTAITLSQNVVTVSGEAIGTLEAGRTYQLGKSLQPSGVRGVSAVSVFANGTALALLTDYTLDSDAGRVTLTATTGFTAGLALTANYTTASNSRSQIKAEGKTLTGALRFVSNNTAGETHDVWVPKARLTPSGNWTLKDRQNPQVLGFDALVLTMAGFAPLYIDGRLRYLLGFDEGGSATAAYTLTAIDGGASNTTYILAGLNGGSSTTVYDFEA